MTKPCTPLWSATVYFEIDFTMTTTPTPLTVAYSGTRMTVQAPTTARKFPTESAFWYALKKVLEAGPRDPEGKSFDLVKKVMSKDGHLVGGDGYPYYLRDRKWGFCIMDPNYAVRDITQELKDKGIVLLQIEYWEN